MIQAAFFRLFDWVENHRWAQAVLTAGLVYLLVRVKEEADEARGRRQANRQWEQRTAAQERRARDYIETTREEAAHEADLAIGDRDRAGPVDPDRMPDAQRRRIFGRYAAAGRGGGSGD